MSEGLSSHYTWKFATPILWYFVIFLNAFLTTIGIGARDLAGPQCFLNENRTVGQSEILDRVTFYAITCALYQSFCILVLMFLAFALKIETLVVIDKNRLFDDPLENHLESHSKERKNTVLINSAIQIVGTNLELIKHVRVNVVKACVLVLDGAEQMDKHRQNWTLAELTRTKVANKRYHGSSTYYSGLLGH